ncbi:PAS domain S-box protein [Nibribacter ruber]|uniref:histidine kinase n=1 Tax=Nibribacter ruber TaxID=2698458 RepID=A0A6P1NW40_9BACT|nr:PAS domain S-box protein [Nibribacter ruber]QHL87927.1 PAS domain S-box protein [Nibribacter ruber]
MSKVAPTPGVDQLSGEQKHGFKPVDFEKMVQTSGNIHCTLDRAGHIEFISDACSTLLGYAPEEVAGKSLAELVKPMDTVPAEDTLRLLLHPNAPVRKRVHLLHKNGAPVLLDWSSRWMEEEEVFYATAKECQYQELSAIPPNQPKDLHEVLVQYGADMVALLNLQGTYTYVGGPTERILGYKAEELLGTSVFQLIHPEDLPEAKASFLALLQSDTYTNSKGFRFKSASGQWRWLDTTASNQLLNPNIQALVVSSRDITEQVESNNRLQESEQKYRNLFEKNPDVVFLQNPQGHIMEVNQSFQKVLSFTPHEVIGQPVTLFLPIENTATSLRYFNESLHGKTTRFEIPLLTKSGERKTFEIVMYPLSLKGSILGVETIAKDITVVKQAFETIQRQAQRLNTVLESITDAFFTLDRNLRITHLNSELVKLLGIDKEDTLGRSILEVFPEEVEDVFRKHYKRMLTTGKSVSFETYLKRKRKWLSVKFFPFEGGLSVYLLDITQRVRYQNELSMLSLVASKITNGVVIMNAHCQIEWVNEGFTSINGYTLPEVIGKRPDDFFHGPKTDAETRRRIFDGYNSGEPFAEEILNYKKNGEEFWVSLNITPVKNEQGKVIRYIAIQTDITSLKQAEEQKAKLTQELNRQNLDLQQFTYIVSHNLRAPVANALGLAKLLPLLDKEDSGYTRAIKGIEKSILSIDTVLKDLNTILTIGFNKDTLGVENINLQAVCTEAIESLRESIDGVHGTIQVSIDPDLRVSGNKAYLFSTFHNLLTNAIKYRSSERELRVEIIATVKNKWVKVLFTDNGSGFDEERVGDKIFKLYQRFHHEVEGRGLGLFMVKTQVESMGGDIQVSSQEGVGTEFLICLRLGQPLVEKQK